MKDQKRNLRTVIDFTHQSDVKYMIAPFVSIFSLMNYYKPVRVAMPEKPKKELLEEADGNNISLMMAYADILQLTEGNSR